MYVKKLRRKCGVRGCKNIDTYSVSLSREAGNTVIICKSCLGKALGAIDDVAPETDVRVSPMEAPPLFFSGRKVTAVEAEAPAEEAVAVTEGVIDNEEAVDVEAEAPAEEVKFVCPHCGQVCKSEQGLQTHIKAKHKDVE